MASRCALNTSTTTSEASDCRGLGYVWYASPTSPPPSICSRLANTERTYYPSPILHRDDQPGDTCCEPAVAVDMSAAASQRSFAYFFYEIYAGLLDVQALLRLLCTKASSFI